MNTIKDKEEGLTLPLFFYKKISNIYYEKEML